ncbi:MAG: methyl-accepting chemotaxis protein [Pirellulaceae bacterium]
MKLRARLTLAFLACGLTPLIAAATLSYYISSNGLAAVSEKAKGDLQAKVETALVGQRAIKQAQVEGYVDMLRNQVLDFSQNPTMIEAMREFREAFADYESERQLDAEGVQKLHSAVADYYTGQFAKEYERENEGESVDSLSLLAKLDATAVAFQHAYIASNLHPLGSKHRLDAADDATRYDELHARHHPSIRAFLERFGYYDIFLVDSETGDIVYSVFKELDYATSLKDGPYADTNIGKVFRKANELTQPGGFEFADYELYLPSYDAPASFLAAPIFDGKEKIGVAIFQMPVDRFTEMMARTDGLGETGETILVGPDYLMRSNSRRDPENHDLVASFRDPEHGKVDTAATRAAIEQGESGSVVTTDYAGNETLISYGPVDILGVPWCLNAKMDTSEALSVLDELGQVSNTATASVLWWNVGLAAIVAVIVAFVAVLIASRIANPIRQAAEFAGLIAKGNLTQRCQAKANAEVGELISAMNAMRDSLCEIVGHLTVNSTTLAGASQQVRDTAVTLSKGAGESKNQSATVSSAAEEMSTNMHNMANTTEEMSSGMKSVSAAVEEMTATISEIARNAEKSATVAADAAKLADVSNQRVGELGTAADEIGKVIEVIQDIAEQTNLLALNATIEAARAGEAGKGFAVVATEVKELAKQTATATDDIRKRIRAIQESSGQSIDAIRQIAEVIGNVNEVARTIASAVEEQNITTKEIAQNVTQTARAAETVNRGVNESSAASAEITKSITRVDEVLNQTVLGAGQSQQSGEELARLATQLQSIVGRFQVESDGSNSPSCAV